MKYLVLFDLHYQLYEERSRERINHILNIEDNFDAVVLGGDNAELSKHLQNHKNLFKSLRNHFNCPIGFIIGNHELWGKSFGFSSTELINDLFPKLAGEYRLTYLEHNNLIVNGTAFVGTYGHFDYSFLREGKGVIKEDLLKGKFKLGEKSNIIWKDRIYMDWEGKGDEEVCASLIDGFESRIINSGKNIISLSHTLPRLTLNSWEDSPEQYFMESYSGSKLLGEVLERYGGRYHFCGHTHKRAMDTIGRTITLNLGSSNNNLRYAILSGEKECGLLEKEVNFPLIQKIE